MFAEVILPKPLYSTYTYAVPPEMTDELRIGSRVLVQFGSKHFYTGLIDSLHSSAPIGHEVKSITAVLDAHPVVRYPQLKLWKWISEYYLCSIGEVFKAALPTGLKPESETYVTLNTDFEAPDGVKLSEQESLVVQLIDHNKKIKIADIEKELKVNNATRYVNSLLDKGIIEIDEYVTERYKPKTETYVEISAARDDDKALHELLGLLSRSRQQEKALMAWLELSGWLKKKQQPREVTRAELLKVADVSPAILSAMVKKGVFRIVKRTISRFNSDKVNESIELPTLSNAQGNALNEIKTQFRNNEIVLLNGVTGSGKTEIYSHLITSALHDGNQVLYLVPEISLTTQLTDRLRKIFGDRLIVYHSKFSDTERVEIWKRLLTSNEPLVILGVRSSVFLPFAKLGLIIVDEEHESSYKQYDPAPRYNARDVSMILANMHGAKTLLGSATPSIETYYKAIHGKYGLVELNERYDNAVLPDVEIIDMREQRKKKLNDGIVSQPLKTALQNILNNKKQAIIFQNRRGFAPIVVCHDCGWTPKCPKCDVSLVYHKNTGTLRCHYCGYSQTLPSLCPACGQNSIETFGYGTERIAEDMSLMFPDARISRMDIDTTRNKNAYQEIIDKFAKHKTDFLIGTQMVSKGLDFDDVGIAAVMNADTLLNFPDFRSNERAFNMLEQVAGRAGRRKEKGNVIIQTTDPKNPVLDFVKKHDYKAFYETEIKERERYAYPPFTRIINIYLKNREQNAVDMAAVYFTNALRNVFCDRVLGPEKPFVSRIALWYIQSIMLKVEAGASMKKVKDLVRQVYASLANEKYIKTSIIYFDVDPV